VNNNDGRRKVNGHSKDQQLEQYRSDNRGKKMTTNQGLRVSEDEHSLKAGVRGPTLMEDFHFREKMTHFDHERIPERVVHARGFGAHGYFQVYEPMTEYTKAKFLQDPSVKTPVFVRFSTVAGSRGSGDTVRDVRGFATKFYTEEGNYDLVGNNIPVFFIRMPSSSLTWCTPLNRNRTTKCRRLLRRTIRFGTLSPTMKKRPT